MTIPSTRWKVALGISVASLPPLEREALIFSEYEGLGLDEIAAIVGADAGTIVASPGSARQRLRIICGICFNLEFVLDNARDEILIPLVCLQ